MAKAAKVETLTLKPSECAVALRAMMKTNRAMFWWGPPGISKSDSARQVATGEGIAFIDMRLSQMDPTDLRGIPYPMKIGGQDGVRWSTPWVLPKDLDISELVLVEEPEVITVHFGNPKGKNHIHYCTNPQITATAIANSAVAKIVDQGLDWVQIGLYEVDESGNATDRLTSGKVRLKVTGLSRGILALEEFNSAPPSVQAAAYQLVLDRALGEYDVPEGVYIMGMGNRDTDKGVTFKMPTPIMNRFVHVEMRPDFDDWQTWALGSMVHPDVVGYLTAFKHHMFDFDAGTAARGFATPRSWHFVSDILSKNDDLPDIVTMGLICGAVGDGIGVQFVEFRRIAADLPDARDILEGRLKKMPKKVEVALAYALTTTLCYELKERLEAMKRKHGKAWATSPERKKWTEEADNFLDFLMENFQPEICIMGAKAAISVHMLPFDTQRMKNFDKFAERYRDFIIV